MGIPKQQKVHKRLADYDERLTIIEAILQAHLLFYGFVCLGAGFLTLLIDDIRRRPVEIGWLQWLGIITFGVMGVWSLVLWWFVKES